MSIKGNGEELFVGKKASNIFTADGKRTAIPYQSLKKLNIVWLPLNKMGN